MQEVSAMSSLMVAGSHVEYLELGVGEPVMLLHSSGSSAGQWRALAEQLSQRYHVIAPDLYGYGGTARWPGQRPFLLECEAEIVLELLRRLGQPAHLVGHSYGGAVALHVADARPGLLRSLTLIEPAAFHLLRGIDTAALAEIVQLAGHVARALEQGAYLAGFDSFFDYWSGTNASKQVPAHKRHAMAAHLVKIGIEFHAALNEPTRLADFRSMSVPTLLVRGACSPLPTRRICQLLEPVLPHAQGKTIAGAGHMSPLTHREQVDALVATHIGTHSRFQLTQPAGAVFRAAASAAEGV
jgi:pimeloyl-ACP methyl ester carboxylesterase